MTYKVTFLPMNITVEVDPEKFPQGLTLHSRLGCQAVVSGDVVVEIPPSGRGGFVAPSH
ncbi:MAG: hypothetical protein HYW16_03915 [Candidatus Rokubacteria bacterium]|nr:hypothetical protein [Candidatus Rokubacteria bacterium]